MAVIVLNLPLKGHSDTFLTFCLQRMRSGSVDNSVLAILFLIAMDAVDLACAGSCS